MSNDINTMKAVFSMIIMKKPMIENINDYYISMKMKKLQCNEEIYINEKCEENIFSMKENIFNENEIYY